MYRYPEMAFQTLINAQTLSAANLTDDQGNAVTPPHANGRYILYQSAKINIPNGVEDLEVAVRYENNIKSSADGVPVSYNITAVLETEDSASNWHPIHGMIEPFQGATSVHDVGGRFHILSYGPNIINFEQTPIDTFAAGEVISRDHRKQGRMPDDFRVVLLLEENRAAGDPGQFASVDVTISYNL